MKHPKIAITVRDYGTMIAELYPEKATKTVEKFLSLVDIASVSHSKHCFLFKAIVNSVFMWFVRKVGGPRTPSATDDLVSLKP